MPAIEHGLLDISIEYFQTVIRVLLIPILHCLRFLEYFPTFKQ